MLKLERIDGIDALTYSLPCGCGITGLFKPAGPENMAEALLAFAHAVGALDSVHAIAHAAETEGRQPTAKEVSDVLGVDMEVVGAATRTH